MTIKVEDITRLSYSCDVCGQSSPPQDYEVGRNAGPPQGWRQFGIGNFPKDRSYCPSCCARHMLGHSSQFTIGEMIDAVLELDEIISPKEKQAC